MQMYIQNKRVVSQSRASFDPISGITSTYSLNNVSIPQNHLYR